MSSRDQAVADLHRPFVSRRGRIMAWAGGIGQALALTACALLLPWSGPNVVGIKDRIGMLVVAAIIGWALSRFGGVRADPSAEGLVVRNLLITRNLSWAEIEGLHFSGGDPWVTLATADGDPVAVMAVQRADGEPARAEAERLATLIAYHHRSA
ncbi:PH domain-containing protein [Kineosporia sp. J2-2]|uniref:PH domain-containing protein n=1 Tax=Kineosporia corallincola TaxID=2835133 RepID=A0ABS5TCY4_9ACTN|nr:PH domain-containing protein [Kineosporia corallincola]MBT0768906.1 PH domain-containing protein [Kineosporia corallincola]